MHGHDCFAEVFAENGKMVINGSVHISITFNRWKEELGLCEVMGPGSDICHLKIWIWDVLLLTY